MSPILQAVIAIFLVSTLSLVGVIFLFIEWSERHEVLALSFAAGVLLGSTFLELLPEAAAAGAGHGNYFAATLAAMVGFFLLERLLRGFHVHEDSDSHAVASAYLILVGDGLHNFIDGIAITASFLASPELGVATTVAVTAHEVPQEIADYGILVAGKFSRGKALLLNFLSGLTALLGALVCYAFGDFVHEHVPWFMAATGGMFIYIAGSDLIPELHHSRWRNSWRATLPFVVGIALIAVLRLFGPQE